MSECEEFMNDLITATEQEVAEAGKFDTDAIRRAWQRSMQIWGGERLYLAKNGEDTRDEMNRRNKAVVRDMNNGERVGLIASRHKISRRMVYKIWDEYLAAKKQRSVTALP